MNNSSEILIVVGLILIVTVRTSLSQMWRKGIPKDCPKCLL